MKKLICALLCLTLCVTGPWSVSLAEETEGEVFPKIDLDLSRMSTTIVYSQIYQMMYDPDAYIGQIIRMTGQYDAYVDEETGVFYTCCLVADAAACCMLGMEFVWAGEHAFPEDYPEIGATITVSGRFETYLEDGWLYAHLMDADMVWERTEPSC